MLILREKQSMDWQTVNSSFIRRIAYFDGCLFVEISREGIYQYFNVQESVYEAFLKAPSKGRFFDLHIKDKYRFQHK